MTATLNCDFISEAIAKAMPQVVKNFSEAAKLDAKIKKERPDIWKALQEMRNAR